MMGVKAAPQPENHMHSQGKQLGHQTFPVHNKNSGMGQNLDGNNSESDVFENNSEISDDSDLSDSEKYSLPDRYAEENQKKQSRRTNGNQREANEKMSHANETQRKPKDNLRKTI